MGLKFTKGNRIIDIPFRTSPSEEDYLIFENGGRKYIDLTSDVSKTDYPNIKFTKGNIVKYAKTKYADIFKSTITIGEGYSSGANEAYGFLNLSNNKFGNMSNKNFFGFTLNAFYISRNSRVNPYLYFIDFGKNDLITQLPVTFSNKEFNFIFNNKKFISKCELVDFGNGNTFSSILMEESIIKEMYNFFASNVGKTLEFRVEII